LGLEGRGKVAESGAPCFNRQLHRCRGACVGEESRDAHLARALESLQPWLLPGWPYRGAVALVERNAERFREDWHVFDRWCWLGTVRTDEAARSLAAGAPCRFVADAARLAIRALGDHSPWALERVDLASL
jgi:hypothetical protein